jgi:hypothetical protein
MIITNASEALNHFQASLSAREMVISDTRKAPTGDGFFHPQIITDSGELYHLKFTKQPYRPKDSDRVSAGARELDEKLKHAIRIFGGGDDTLVGVNDEVILGLLEASISMASVYFVTVIGDGRVLWRSAVEFYNFVMRYDTFFKFARQNVPQAMVPTGWLKKWDLPKTGAGKII